MDDAQATHTWTRTCFGLFSALIWSALLLIPKIPKVSERFKHNMPPSGGMDSETLQRWTHKSKVARTEIKGVWMNIRSTKLRDQAQGSRGKA